MKNNGIIYKAVNKVNGKCYVGNTINSLKHRMGEHLREAKRHPNSVNAFRKAINEFGPDNFEWSVIDSFTNHGDGVEKEIMWIKQLKTLSDETSEYYGGYNAILGYNWCSINVTPTDLTNNITKLEKDGWSFPPAPGKDKHYDHSGHWDCALRIDYLDNNIVLERRCPCGSEDNESGYSWIEDSFYDLQGKEVKLDNRECYAILNHNPKPAKPVKLTRQMILEKLASFEDSSNMY